MSNRNMIARWSDNPAKKRLCEYIWLMRRKESLEREIREHYDSAYSCTTRLNPMRGSNGGTAYDRIAQDVCAAVDAKQQLSEKIAEINAEMADILRLVEIPSDQRLRTLLTLRYIEGCSWDKIQERMHYEHTRVMILHGRALAIINEEIAKNAGKQEQPIPRRDHV